MYASPRSSPAYQESMYLETLLVRLDAAVERSDAHGTVAESGYLSAADLASRGGRGHLIKGDGSFFFAGNDNLYLL
jgi:hypothetical protein